MFFSSIWRQEKTFWDYLNLYDCSLQKFLKICLNKMSCFLSIFNTYTQNPSILTFHLVQLHKLFGPIVETSAIVLHNHWWSLIMKRNHSVRKTSFLLKGVFEYILWMLARWQKNCHYRPLHAMVVIKILNIV